MAVILLIVRLSLAAVFVVAAGTKLADVAGTRRAITSFGVPQGLATPLGWALPLLELLVAALLIPGTTAWLGGWGALALLAGFSVGIAVNLSRGNAPDCHCFGQLHSEPISEWTLARNGLLAALSLVVISWGRVNRDPTAFNTLSQVSLARWVELGAGALIVLLLALQLWFMARLMRQNEQVLIRVKMIESDVRDGAPAIHQSTEEEIQGLPPGSTAPQFSVTDLAGVTVTLDGLCLMGKMLFLVFVDPACVPCNSLMPKIAEWQHDLSETLEVIVISSGTVEANRRKAAQHGVMGVYLQDGRKVEGLYQVPGNPAAVLLRPDRTVGSPVATGPEAIESLLSEVLKLLGGPLTLSTEAGALHASANGHSHLSGPEINLPAPSVRLPDLGGRIFDLAECHGERTVVLFWDTGCGFCQQMAPALRAWDDQPPVDAPRLVLVATGSEDELRAMNLRSTVLVDRDFATASAFDINGTPLAALLDAGGTYVTRVAGEPDILAILRGEVKWAPVGV
jgi:thiol-disulfide isomerase/thioredoxin/uncharacterized membrane protein YphA (DoxX/SURF4 family)